MNESAVFLVGIAIFAITIYGVVMAGGLALTRVMTDEQPRRQPSAVDRPPGSTVSVDERGPTLL